MRAKMLNIIMYNIGFELWELPQLTIEFRGMSFGIMLLYVSRQKKIFCFVFVCLFFIFMRILHINGLLFSLRGNITFLFITTTHKAWKINSICLIIKKNFMPDHLSEVGNFVAFFLFSFVFVGSYAVITEIPYFLYVIKHTCGT